MRVAQVKPFCEKHSRMGEWEVREYFGSVIPFEILIVCEECS